MKSQTLTRYCAALLAGQALLLPLPAAAQAPATAQTSAPAVPPIAFTSRTLANGLRVYSIPDQSSPNVSVEVWYDVGSKNDPKGRSGFAHLFEHLMFKASRNLVPEQFDRLTEDVGGFNNASTNDDYTNYFEVVPANHLQRLLWAEAERMGSLVVEPGFFKSERDVVKEEFRSRVLAQPYGKLFYLYLPQVSFSVHPYARPGIGSIEDLDAATIDDVRAFHATYYRPDNAVLVVAGRFDQAQLDRWVDQYFGPIARPSTPLPPVRVVEPARTAKTYTVYEPNTPLPAVLLSYPGPRAADRDSAVMEVLSAILSSGKSSRLYQSLIYRDRIATSADVFNGESQDPGLLAAYAILASGKTAVEGEAALRREIARLRDEPVSDAELQEAKNELLTAALKERETVDGKSTAIAEAVIVSGDARAADRRVALIAQTSKADVQRVARKYLTDSQSAAVRYLPQGDGAKGGGDTIVTPATVQVAPLVAPANIVIVQPASDQERVAPPAPGPEVRADLPVPVTQKLANGMTLITVARPDLPLATAMLVSTSGGAADPAGKAGLSQMTAALLAKGTATRTASQIAQQMEALGGSLETAAGYDGSRAGLTVKSDQLAAAMPILADVVRNPAFAAEEIERQRAINVDEVTVALQDPGSIASIVGIRAAFGPAGYGPPASGTPASLKAISRDDIVAAYSRSFRPDQTTLILTGDIDPERARAIAERNFGDWTTAPVATASAASAPPPGGRVIVVDMPDAGQAAVALLKPTLTRSDPRYYQTLVANAVLGTGFSSRLNQEVRIKRGLAYGASSQIAGRRMTGPFVAATQTKNPSAPEVLKLIVGEMTRLGTQPIPDAELTTRKAVLNGSIGRQFETTSGLAGLVSSYVQQGVNPAEIARFQSAVSAVTPQQAGAAARDLLAPAGATIVIVGDARQFLDAVRAAYPDVTVIPLKELDVQDLPAER
ncbi:insulinase family protein [Sphingomonas sabuli]|uniref:Insulinase family protein n=1 Tax=Sphingomonas sabuli TaxID=2764186 RepID=A0A7G9KZY4_9SPHN|nr:pitrilysin family protein [Sphingomonas sabuli]QNM81933.1 insulinase family protein [Sphingomonas sabuli]